MDKLDIIFDMQNKLDEFIREKRNLNFSKEEWIQKEVLAMLSELSELLDEVNFKWWKNKKEIDDGKLKDELVDILHFFVAMCLISGMSSKELFERYLNKNDENFKRQFGKSAKEGYSILENK